MLMNVNKPWSLVKNIHHLMWKSGHEHVMWMWYGMFCTDINQFTLYNPDIAAVCKNVNCPWNELFMLERWGWVQRFLGLGHFIFCQWQQGEQAVNTNKDMSLYLVIFSLTLHGKSLSRHRDVALALHGEAVMRQVVILREFHQRVICWGKARVVNENRPRNEQQDSFVLSGVDERCVVTLGSAGLVGNKLSYENKKTHTHRDLCPPLIWPVFAPLIRKLMMSAGRSMSFCPNCVHTNYKQWVTSWRADSILTCNKRRSTKGDERVQAGLQVSHHMFHHSVHCLDQAADHRGGLLDTKPKERKKVYNHHYLILTDLQLSYVIIFYNYKKDVMMLHSNPAHPQKKGFIGWLR